MRLQIEIPQKKSTIYGLHVPAIAVGRESVVKLCPTLPPFVGAPRLAVRGLVSRETQKLIFALSLRDLSFVTVNDTRQVFPPGTINISSGQPDTAVSHHSANLTVVRTTKLPEWCLSVEMSE